MKKRTGPWEDGPSMEGEEVPEEALEEDDESIFDSHEEEEQGDVPMVKQRESDFDSGFDEVDDDEREWKSEMENEYLQEIDEFHFPVGTQVHLNELRYLGAPLAGALEQGRRSWWLMMQSCTAAVRAACWPSMLQRPDIRARLQAGLVGRARLENTGGRCLQMSTVRWVR